MRRRFHRPEPADIVIDAKVTEPLVTVTSRLPSLRSQDMRVLVLAHLLNNLEGQHTGIPSEAHDWARLVTGLDDD